jgi:hypothetical protein
MKENQKLTLKIIFMSVIVLSCADNNVTQINYSNATVKNDEVKFLQIEKKKTSENRISSLTLKKIEKNSNENTVGKKPENNKPVIESDNSKILIQNKKFISKVQKKKLNKLEKIFEEKEIKDKNEKPEISFSPNPIDSISDNITQKQDENDLLAINAALAMLSKPSKNQ